MPANHPSANRYKNQLLRDVLEINMVFTYRCNSCRREVSFLAMDLVKVMGPEHQTHIPPFPCSKCKTREYISVGRRVPSAAELEAGVQVRRPVQRVTRWLWRTEKL